MEIGHNLAKQSLYDIVFFDSTSMQLNGEGGSVPLWYRYRDIWYRYYTGVPIWYQHQAITDGYCYSILRYSCTTGTLAD